MKTPFTVFATYYFFPGDKIAPHHWFNSVTFPKKSPPIQAASHVAVTCARGSCHGCVVQSVASSTVVRHCECLLCYRSPLVLSCCIKSEAEVLLLWLLINTFSLPQSKKNLEVR